MAKKINFTKAALDAIVLPAPGQRATLHGAKITGLQLRVTSQGIKTFCVRRRTKRGDVERITLGRYPDMTLRDEPNETIRDYILIALLTGARRSNTLAMRWEEISFERGEWRIPVTKNGTPQVVTLTSESLAILGKSLNHKSIQPRNLSWTRLSVRFSGRLARRDDAAGPAPQGGATRPGGAKTVQSGA